jgi:hypothetical protein
MLILHILIPLQKKELFLTKKFMVKHVDLNHSQ